MCSTACNSDMVGYGPEKQAPFRAHLALNNCQWIGNAGIPYNDYLDPDSAVTTVQSS